MSDNRDIKRELYDRDKDRIIAASAGAVAASAGIVAAQISMQDDQEVIEQVDSNIEEVNLDAVVNALSLADVPNEEVIICKVEIDNSSEVEILAIEIDYSNGEIYNIETIEEILLLDETNLYFANADDFLDDIDIDSCCAACECQIDGEILV